MKRKFHIGWVYVIEDDAPAKTRSKNDKVLKLQNEIADFVKEENGKVLLKIVR